MDENKRSKLWIIIVFSILVVGLVVGLYIRYINSDSYKLQKMGYSKEEVKDIIKINKHVDELLKMNYNPMLVSILKEKYYIDKNFLEYVSYMNNNIDKNSSDIVAIVNVRANLTWYTNPIDTDVSRDYEMLVNKFYKLPVEYAPDDIVPIKNWYAYEGHSIREEVYSHYLDMFNAAKNNGLSIIVNSSYRTRENQAEIYTFYKNRYGLEYADSYAARTDHSEHQTGLSLDIIKPGVSGEDFDLTDEFNWLVGNAHKYGFILRYPEGKEYLTGYGYESWHYRYIGVDLAGKVYESGLTYDEYYAYYLD